MVIGNTVGSKMDKVDCVVIGAGVVGLAVARALALSGRETWVFEREAGIGTGISSRNSEVIHAGIYYPVGSQKSKLCLTGREMLYAYCQERAVPHKRCGKLLVATSDAEKSQLKAIMQKALLLGVTDLKWLSKEEAEEIEPALHCSAAVLSPSTGIIDSHSLMLAYQGDIENAGGYVVSRSELVSAQCSIGGINLVMADGTEIFARTVVNAAGLDAPALAYRFKGFPSSMIPQTFFAKGNYFSLSGKAPFSHLIYPMPQIGGLGVHLTLDLGGQAKFGPDVEWVDGYDNYEVNPERCEGFYSQIRQYWPSLADDALLPAYSGIRPKLSGPKDTAADFLLQGGESHGVAGLVNLFGIESPGLTSSLAIGDWVQKSVAMEETHRR